MFYGFICDYVMTDADVERFAGWCAHGLGLASAILSAGHPYLAAPP